MTTQRSLGGRTALMTLLKGSSGCVFDPAWPYLWDMRDALRLLPQSVSPLISYKYSGTGHPLINPHLSSLFPPALYTFCDACSVHGNLRAMGLTSPTPGQLLREAVIFWSIGLILYVGRMSVLAFDLLLSPSMKGLLHTGVRGQSQAAL